MATSKPLEISKLGWETCLYSQDAPLILVSHNDKFTRAILCLEMEIEGYQVIEAYNAQQCIEAYKIFHPDLVILDTTIPEIDGFICCRQIRKITAKFATPILMITSHDATSIEEAFVAGATDCISQPIPWIALRPRVRQLIGRSFLTQDILELSTQLAHRRLEQIPLQAELCNPSREGLGAPSLSGAGKKVIKIKGFRNSECVSTSGCDRTLRSEIIDCSTVGRILDNKEIACGDNLTGTGNSLVKSSRSRKKSPEARLQSAS